MRLLILAHEHHASVGFWADYTGLLRDKAHAAFELTWEAVTFLVTYPIAKWRVRVHDRKHHSADEQAERLTKKVIAIVNGDLEEN